MAKRASVGQLTWRSLRVDGREARYGVAGSGLPVLFEPGWALGRHAYQRALAHLVRLGCQVYAPALPGCGGSASPPRANCDLAGYAAWLDAFLRQVEVDEPMVAVGHSFGGGVAAKLAHDFPDGVASLVLVNSVAGGVWRQAGNRARSMAERPLWSWAAHFPSDLLTAPGLSTLGVVLEDAIPNIARNPCGLWRVASLARRVDLTADLAELKARRLPVLVLWGEGDGIIPRASFESLCATVGADGRVVPGRHAWLLGDPDGFGEVIANPVAEAQAARVARDGRAPGSGRVGWARPAPAADAAR
jgi:pimeloyl-ACP methyl ester carboxylesterase